MNDHADPTPEQPAGAGIPAAATRRDQRERETASPGATASDADQARDASQEPVEHTATTDHDVIRRWAEDRHATPATVSGAGHDGEVGELRIDFDFGNDLEELRELSWDEWFRAFDERGLEFVFQDGTRPDGSASNDFRLEPAAGTHA